MREDYEINRGTLALIPEGEETTRVYEVDQEFLVKKSAYQIVDDSCKYFGSSYMGRLDGTKALVGYNYKAPIIIEETNKIIFFPTTSPRQTDCTWISLNNIKEYLKIEKKSLIIFKNDKNIEIDMSYGTLENQILRATKLWCTIDKILDNVNN